MDPLTHMLAGAALADVLENPRARHPAALPFAMTLAALPDIDVLPAFWAAFPRNPFSSAGLFDMDVMRAMHRGYTHALPILLAAGIVSALAIWCMTGKKRLFSSWLLLALSALLSHSVLDMTNGPVQIWRPFSEMWWGFGQAPEADPAVWTVLLLCLLTNHPPRWKQGRRFLTVRLVQEAGAALHKAIRTRLSARAVALIALTATAASIAARLTLG